MRLWMTRAVCLGCAVLALGAACSAVVTTAQAADAKTVHALAMHGTPKYGQGFERFDYVNPDAPQGGTIKFGIVGTFDSLNPFIVRGQFPSPPAFDMKGAVFEPLMARSWDEPFTLYGLLAQTVDVPEDRSSITFNLDPEAHWQDGKPVTAEDVLFSYTTLRDHGRPNHRTYYAKVAKAEKLGVRRVRFTFSRDAQGVIDREMPLIMGLMPVLPQHDWQGRDFNQPTLRPLLGSGPYQIAKIEPGRSLTLQRDPHYWGHKTPAQKGHYNFDTVVFDYYRDDSVALQAFGAGQFDVRRETSPAKWASSYDGPSLKDGRVKQETFAHHRPEAMYGFIFNTRRALLADVVLRRAMSDAFDFEWINATLFRGLYKRTQSFFPNSELAATGKPKGREKTLLLRFKEQIPGEVLGQDAESFTAKPGEDARTRLVESAKALKRAGYTLRDDKLFTPRGEPVEVEIMLSDPGEEKVALEWARCLRRLGIGARVRTVDSAQYQKRLSAFDYDITTGRWFNTLSPGNEQTAYWGSAAANEQGSRNYAGVKNPAVDALASAISQSRTREELVATARALDRVLLAGHYLVPLYHLGADLVAYWTSRLKHPGTTPLYGAIVETWWNP